MKYNVIDNCDYKEINNWSIPDGSIGKPRLTMNVKVNTLIKSQIHILMTKRFTCVRAISAMGVTCKH